jgi:hypothetical protein
MRWIAIVVLAACGGPGSSAPDAGVDADGCVRAPAAADRDRKVVVSHPFAAGQNVYRVLDLSRAGELTDPGVTFTMGRSNLGEIAFTPDGEIGIAVQDDGTLGVFRLDDDGAPEVLHAAFAGDFYASRVVMEADGATAYVLDGNWRENGGGVYRLAIGCDDTITDRGLWFPAKLPAGLALSGDRLLLAAADVDGSTAGDDVHALDLAVDPPSHAAGADPFPDDEAIVGGTALTSDRQFFLIGDNSGFASVPNRVAVVRVGDSMEVVQTLSPIEDPLALVASPFGDVVLAVSGFGDAVFVLDQGTDGFTLRGEMTYDGASPQLPGGAVVIERGPLRGLVLLAENVGVRRIELAGAGTVTDRGLTSLGSGNAAITGSIGVQP